MPGFCSLLGFSTKRMGAQSVVAVNGLSQPQVSVMACDLDELVPDVRERPWSTGPPRSWQPTRTDESAPAAGSSRSRSWWSPASTQMGLARSGGALATSGDPPRAARSQAGRRGPGRTKRRMGRLPPLPLRPPRPISAQTRRRRITSRRIPPLLHLSPAGTSRKEVAPRALSGTRLLHIRGEDPIKLTGAPHD